MSVMHGLASVVGKALRPIHAGERKLVLHKLGLERRVKDDSIVLWFGRLHGNANLPEDAETGAFLLAVEITRLERVLQVRDGGGRVAHG